MYYLSDNRLPQYPKNPWDFITSSDIEDGINNKFYEIMDDFLIKCDPAPNFLEKFGDGNPDPDKVKLHKDILSYLLNTNKTHYNIFVEISDKYVEEFFVIIDD
jgi:hypothetical protein